MPLQGDARAAATGRTAHERKAGRAPPRALASLGLALAALALTAAAPAPAPNPPIPAAKATAAAPAPTPIPPNPTAQATTAPATIAPPTAIPPGQATAAPAPSAPPPIAAFRQPPDPSDPLEQLYGRKQLTFEKGVPTVTVRLMESQPSVTFVPTGRMRLLARGTPPKTLEAPANTTWTVRLKGFEPPVMTWSVQVAELRWGDREQLAQLRQLWEGRGQTVRTRTIGSLHGIAGRVLDTRRHAVFIGEPTTEEVGKESLKNLQRDYGFQGTLVPTLIERPHGQLEVVDASGLVLAVGQDLVSVSSPEKAPFQVKSVEHGIGYSWHARQDRTYRGDLALVVDRTGGIAVVNVVPMESYVRGIVASEIYSKAHAEALKAQAVTARGEVLAKLGTRHLTDPYLLCAEQHCQVYSGLSGETPTTDAAVVATAGEALFEHGGRRLVDSVYSAVCGGHTEDNEDVWNTPVDPALRGRPDLVEEPAPAFRAGIGDQNLGSFLASEAKAYCSVSSFANPKKYRWEKRFTQAAVDALLAPLGVQRVRVMAVARRGSSGRATVLSISGEEGATQVRGELTIRRLFGNLNSAMFQVEPPGGAHPGEWVFTGGGWGHGVGMCQVGAIGRAERGQNYRQILGHYFNGADVVRLY